MQLRSFGIEKLERAAPKPKIKPQVIYSLLESVCRQSNEFNHAIKAERVWLLYLEVC